MPKIVKWSEQEDELLRELVEREEKRWKVISSFFKNKNPRQCNYRWKALTSCQKDTRPFTEDEWIELKNFQLIYGNKWAKIEKLMGRDQNLLKNKWHSRTRKENLKEKIGQTSKKFGKPEKKMRFEEPLSKFEQPSKNLEEEPSNKLEDSEGSRTNGNSPPYVLEEQSTIFKDDCVEFHSSTQDLETPAKTEDVCIQDLELIVESFFV